MKINVRLKPGDHSPLSKIKKGTRAKVIKINTVDKALRRRLLDMGITEGVQVKIKKIAPLGDPIDIELRGYELCLRKADLEMIEVEVIS
ncbi:MAG: FeoA family protein [Acholeplasmataceae bacterium]|jgi:ferrous iron transport protein A|nr:FeoA family protein [Acholeplasmataceae bacterium]